MTKKRSPHTVKIVPDRQDVHFSIVQLVKAKTGAVVCEHYILTTDVPQWCDAYRKDGFRQVKL